MSQLFANYESDFKVSYTEAQQRLSQISGLVDNSQRLSGMKAVEANIDECFEVVEQMGIEVQNISTAQRSSYNAKIRTYQADLNRLRKELKSLMDDEDRRNLFGDYPEQSGATDAAYSQRQQLLKSNASLDRSTQRLQESTRTALETEDVGAGILNSLRGQREQLINARDTLMEADSYVDRSISTLKSMTRRMVANKFISYAIIAVLVILILLVMINKIR
ncbi:unnamed protein product [Kuraishia capsulata CBS 1993]|uniref:t-SNARE coiled-coil homology domain-containing protein n=1 Tax=Kuraishia capsulata CBS 1993 TaxID=1382522 RepID=W6MT90_9ASCO|nr:uncharacterized protein KUCA_T00005601001 [Kuraishia capsulata CBS 1993]CDK29608.1 unnamed protein product [Kuraishia capsulata CBS 1993]